jgi:hypothetical protein
MSIYKKYTLLVHENDELMMSAAYVQNILNGYFQNEDDSGEPRDILKVWVLEAKSEEVDGPSLD